MAGDAVDDLRRRLARHPDVSGAHVVATERETDGLRIDFRWHRCAATYTWILPLDGTDDEDAEVLLLEELDTGLVNRCVPRQLLDGRIELTDDEWPMDRRFFLQEGDALTWEGLALAMRDEGLDPTLALRAGPTDETIWTAAYVNNRHGAPHVGQALAVAAEDHYELVLVETRDDVPDTVAVEVVQYALACAAERGCTRMTTALDGPWARPLGFRGEGEQGHAVARTDQLDADPGELERMLRDSASWRPGREIRRLARRSGTRVSFAH